MKFAKSEKELIGKEIAWIHFPKYGDEMIIATTDKTVLMFMRHYEEEETEVFNEGVCRIIIMNNTYVREILFNSGIITEEDFLQFEKERKKEFEERERKQEELRKKREYEEYLKLKNKFENN